MALAAARMNSPPANVSSAPGPALPPDETTRPAEPTPATGSILRGQMRTAVMAAIALMLIVLIASVQNLREVREVGRMRADTHKVLRELETLFALLTDIETGARGYALTGERVFLEPYERGTAALPAQRAEVAGLAILRPEQRNVLRQLDQLVVARAASSRQLVETRDQSGSEAARQHVLTYRGKNLMDQVRKIFTDWEHAERAVLLELEERQEIGARRNTIAVMGGGTVATVLVGLAGLLLHREVRRRRQAQSDLLAANQQLEHRVGERTAALAGVNSNLQAEVAERCKAEAALNRSNRALRTLSECSQAMLRARTEGELLQENCRILVEFGGYCLAWIGRAEAGPGKPVRCAACAGAGAELVDALELSWADSDRGRNALGTAIRTRQLVIARDLDEGGAGSDHSPLPIPPGATAVIILPLVAGNDTLGALSIYADRADAFDAGERRLLQELADDLAFGVQTLRTRAHHEQLQRQNQVILNRMPLGCVLFDRQLRFAFVNPAAEAIFGYTHGELYATTAYASIVPPEAHGPVAEIVERVLAGDMTAHQTNSNRTKDGRTIMCRWFNTPIRNSAGEVEWILAMVEDITDRLRVEDALRQSERNYREIFNAATDAIFIHDAVSGRIEDVNDAMLRMFGTDRAQALRLQPGDASEGGLAHSAAAARQWLDKAVREGPQLFEWKAQKASGETFWVEVALRSADLGGRPRVIALVRDITERKQAAAELETLQQRLRDIIEHSTNLFYMHSPDHVLTYVSPQARTFFNAEPAEALVRWTEFVTDHPVNRQAIENTQRAIDTGQPQPPYAVQLKTRTGRILWAEVREAPVVRDGRCVAVVGSLTDITERKQADESLRALTAHLLQVQDEERRRLGRELHDSTSQTLAALEINLSLVNAAQTLDARTRRLIGDTLQQVKQAGNDIRTLSYLLHPPLLDEVGLASALSWYVDGFNQRSQLAVTLAVPEDLGRFPPAVELALFRVVQECLANILRHSGSRTAHLTLVRSGPELHLTVADQGRGIPAATLDALTGRGGRLGVGLAGMRERVRQLGGNFTVQSSPAGTTVRVNLPVHPDERQT